MQADVISIWVASERIILVGSSVCRDNLKGSLCASAVFHGLDYITCTFPEQSIQIHREKGVVSALNRGLSVEQAISPRKQKLLEQNGRSGFILVREWEVYAHSVSRQTCSLICSSSREFEIRHCCDWLVTLKGNLGQENRSILVGCYSRRLEQFKYLAAKAIALRSGIKSRFWWMNIGFPADSRQNLFNGFTIDPCKPGLELLSNVIKSNYHQW